MAVFWMIKLAPGDPLDLLLAGNPDMSPEHVEHIKSLYGFDQPIYEQYARWLFQVAQGNLGFSRTYSRPITSILPERLWNTLILTGSSLVLSLLIAIPIGIYTALKQYSILDNVFSFLAFFGISMPIFWFALILIYIFSLSLHWLPPGGHYSLENEVNFLTIIRYMIMPVLVLSLFSIASWMRYMRSGMLEVLNEDYVRTARAKGLKERRVLFLHAFKNALMPMITLIMLTIPSMIGGAVLTETIFSWPGMGRLIFDSLIGNDFNMAMAVFLIFAVLVAFFNLLADILYAVIDPRVKNT